MKAALMYRDRDFDPAQELPPRADALIGDLGLQVLLDAMAGDDTFLKEVATTALLCSLGDVSEIRYRQDVLRDCIANPAIVRALYDLSVEAIESERKHYWGLMSRQPSGILHRSVEVLQTFVGLLRRLRSAAARQEIKFKSDGFRTLFGMLQRELDEEYLRLVETHLDRLKFRRGALISAALGKGNQGTAYALRKPNTDDRAWARRVLAPRQPAYTFHIPERDEAGARALGELKDRGLNIAANAMAQSADHILGFFRMLRAELAFYVGCLNLYDRLSAKDMPTCFPDPAPCGERRQTARRLYDASLALISDRPVVGNDIDADGKDLFIITGANQGGKSTWLRAIGAAQLMMQCGLFVPARSYCANICTGLFVHYRREEDVEMLAGKFEEELQRVSAIVDDLSTDGIVLFNESLQSTNEREGSEIGRQIVEALLDSRVKVFFVTHMYDLAGKLHDKRRAASVFLRPERHEGGIRTFRIVLGAPLPTSHARDVYDEIFGESDQRIAAGCQATAGRGDPRSVR